MNLLDNIEDVELEPDGGLVSTPGGPVMDFGPAADVDSVVVFDNTTGSVVPAEVVPALAVFVADVRLRDVANAMAVQLAAVDVSAPGGLERADVALTQARDAVKAIEVAFEQATRDANARHKRLTGMRAEWCASANGAIDAKEREVLAERRKQEQAAADQRRRDQEQSDAAVREQIARTAEAAKSVGAPSQVVQALEERAKTATAPPVRSAGPAPLKGSRVQKTWRTRFAGSPAEADPHPLVKDLTDAQRLEILKLCKAIVDGKAPIAVIKEIDWGYLDKRAAAEGTLLNIPGIEAFEDEDLRAKPTRRK